MDDRRPAKGGRTEPGLQASSPAAHSSDLGFQLLLVMIGAHSGHIHVRGERLLERITSPAAGLGHQVTVQVDGGRDRLVAEQRETSEMGTPFGERGASESVSKITKCHITGRWAAATAGFQIVLLYTSRRSSLPSARDMARRPERGRAAQQHGDGGPEEAGHRHLPDRRSDLQKHTAVTRGVPQHSDPS